MVRPYLWFFKSSPLLHRFTWAYYFDNIPLLFFIIHNWSKFFQPNALLGISYLQLKNLRSFWCRKVDASEMRENQVSGMWENAYLSIKIPKASPAADSLLCSSLLRSVGNFPPRKLGPPPLTKSWIRTWKGLFFILTNNRMVHDSMTSSLHRFSYPR